MQQEEQWPQDDERHPDPDWSGIITGIVVMFFCGGLLLAAVKGWLHDEPFHVHQLVRHNSGAAPTRGSE